MIYSLIVAIVVALAYIFHRTFKGGWLSLGLKALASACAVCLAFISYMQTGKTVGLYIAIGMIFGLIGDVVLELKGLDLKRADGYLFAGFVSFAIQHVITFIGVIPLFGGNALTVALIGVGVGIVATVIGMIIVTRKMDLGKFAVVGGGYIGTLICCACCYVVGLFFTTEYFVLAIALVLFLLSDLVLSEIYFDGKENKKRFIFSNLLLYYSAQIVLAIFVLTI